MNAYDCHYYDRKGNHRIFCTYAKDVLTARYTLIELVGKDLRVDLGEKVFVGARNDALTRNR